MNNRMCDVPSCGTKDKHETLPVFFLPEKHRWLHTAEVKLEVKHKPSVFSFTTTIRQQTEGDKKCKISQLQCRALLGGSWIQRRDYRHSAGVMSSWVFGKESPLGEAINLQIAASVFWPRLHPVPPLLLFLEGGGVWSQMLHKNRYKQMRYSTESLSEPFSTD